jgi:hypothetical protein
MELWTIEPNGEEIEVACERVQDFETEDGTFVDVVYFENGNDVEFVTALYVGTEDVAEITEDDWEVARKQAILAILADAA